MHESLTDPPKGSSEFNIISLLHSLLMIQELLENALIRAANEDPEETAVNQDVAQQELALFDDFS